MLDNSYTIKLSKWHVDQARPQGIRNPVGIEHQPGAGPELASSVGLQQIGLLPAALHTLLLPDQCEPCAGNGEDALSQGRQSTTDSPKADTQNDVHIFQGFHVSKASVVHADTQSQPRKQRKRTRHRIQELEAYLTRKQSEVKVLLSEHLALKAKLRGLELAVDCRAEQVNKMQEALLFGHAHATMRATAAQGCMGSGAFASGQHPAAAPAPLQTSTAAAAGIAQIVESFHAAAVRMQQIMSTHGARGVGGSSSGATGGGSTATTSSCTTALLPPVGAPLQRYDSNLSATMLQASTGAAATDSSSCACVEPGVMGHLITSRASVTSVMPRADATAAAATAGTARSLVSYQMEPLRPSPSFPAAWATGAVPGSAHMWARLSTGANSNGNRAAALCLQPPGSFALHLQQQRLQAAALAVGPPPATGGAAAAAGSLLDAAVQELCTTWSTLRVSNPLLPRAFGQPMLLQASRQAPESHWLQVVRQLHLSSGQLADAIGLLLLAQPWLQSQRQLHVSAATTLGQLVQHEPASAREAFATDHARALVLGKVELCDAAARLARLDWSTLVLLDGVLMTRILTPLQAARCLVLSHPYIPDPLALLAAAAQLTSSSNAPSPPACADAGVGVGPARRTCFPGL